MKKILVSILTATSVLMVASCGDGVKQRPSKHATQAEIGTIEEKDSETEVKSKGPITISYNSKPEVFDRYKIVFWDSVKSPKEKKHHGEIFASSIGPAHHEDFTSINKHQLAYKLGESFASSQQQLTNNRMDLVKSLMPEVAAKDSTANETDKPEKYFFKCIKSAENNSQNGTIALMISGYYFGKLSEILSDANSTNLPDEKALASGIEKLDSLKSYCNDVILDESDINITVPLQKICTSADNIKKIYQQCITSSTNDKYGKLYESIQEVERDAFSKKK